MKIIFVRHGHPNYELNCLTELGHKHAVAAAQRLKNDGITEIYSSPYGRAVETAEHTAKVLGLDVQILDFMHEIIWGDEGKEPYKTGHPWSIADEMAKSGMNLMDPNWRENSPFKGNLLIEHNDWLAEELDKWMETLGYTREDDRAVQPWRLFRFRNRAPDESAVSVCDLYREPGLHRDHRARFQR